MTAEMRPFPGKHGKPYVELFSVRTKEEMCLGCLEMCLGANLDSIPWSNDLRVIKMRRETIRLKCMVREQLREGLSKRQGHLCGITNAIPISRIIGVDISDFIAFHNTVVEAAKKRS